jgi:ribosomal protein S18 acetylase RimI-like enzyme
MNDRYTVRRAQSADLDHLVELLLALQDHVEAANPTLWQMKSEAKANLKGQLVARLTAKDTCALVAEHEEEGVVGLLFGRVVANKRYKPDRTGQVDQAFVQVGHRRTGVGTRLVSELCRFFAERGIEDISLRYVVGNDEAADFWMSLGFSPRILTAGAHRREIEAQLATRPDP